jgi:hypothetical protein
MDFGQDWFLRQVESFAEGFARKLLGKPPEHQEYVEARQYGGDDLIYARLCALLARLEFCAAEDLLWEHLRPGDLDGLLLAEEFYRQLGGFGDGALEAHGFSRPEVGEGLARARAFIKGG